MTRIPPASCRHEAPVEQDADQEIDSHFVPNPEEAQADGSDESQKRWDQAEKLQEDIRRAGEASPPKMRSTRYFRILVVRFSIIYPATVLLKPIWPFLGIENYSLGRAAHA